MYEPMGKPRQLCRLLSYRRLPTPWRNVQPDFRLQAGPLRTQHQREEGLLPLSQTHQLGWRLRQVRSECSLKHPDQHGVEHTGALHGHLQFRELQLRRGARRGDLLVRKRGTFDGRRQTRRMQHSVPGQPGSDVRSSLFHECVRNRSRHLAVH